MDGSGASFAIDIGPAGVTDAAEAFAVLLAPELDRAYRLATVILGNAIEAEDVVADAALSAWRARATLREAERFEAWFGRIVLNACRDRLRTRRRHPVAELPRDEVVPGEPPRLDFRDGVHAREEMSRAFEVLDPDERIVVALRYWHDLSVDSIAERIGVPAGTVKSRLHNALDHLRAAIVAGEIER